MDKLTFKQEKFVGEYLKDGNATRAVREAYPNAKSEGAMRAMASENLTKPNIQKKIQDVLNEAGLSPELIVGELKKLIQDEDKTEKNKAIRTAAEIMGLIGKGGLIAAQVNISQQFNPADIAETRERFRKMEERRFNLVNEIINELINVYKIDNEEFFEKIKKLISIWGAKEFL